MTVCMFDPAEVVRGEQKDREGDKAGGTIAPIVTIMLLIMGTMLVIIIVFRGNIMNHLKGITKRKPKEEREPSMSELEIMEVDPFQSECKSVKTFSVKNGVSSHNHV